MEKKKNHRKGMQDTEGPADSRERETDTQEPEICREVSVEAEKENSGNGLRPSDQGEQEAAATAGSRFTREQLTASIRFRDRQDLLHALLSPGETYSIADVEQMIDKYGKGKVK